VGKEEVGELEKCLFDEHCIPSLLLTRRGGGERKRKEGGGKGEL
jgi:hypothetical protein